MFHVTVNPENTSLHHDRVLRGFIPISAHKASFPAWHPPSFRSRACLRDPFQSCRLICPPVDCDPSPVRWRSSKQDCDAPQGRLVDICSVRTLSWHIQIDSWSPRYFVSSGDQSAHSFRLEDSSPCLAHPLDMLF